jgi:hypothetical protein
VSPFDYRSAQNLMNAPDRFGIPLLQISTLPLTLVGVALFSGKKGRGFVIFYILRTIYEVDHFAPRTNGLTDSHSAISSRPLSAGFQSHQTSSRTL